MRTYISAKFVNAKASKSQLQHSRGFIFQLTGVKEEKLRIYPELIKNTDRGEHYMFCYSA